VEELVNIYAVSNKFWTFSLLAFAISLSPTVLMAQELPGFSGGYRNWSQPFSLFIGLQGDGTLKSWDDVCCMQLGRCRACVPKPISMPKDMTEVNVVRLQGKKNELFICFDPKTDRILQCPVVFYEKGTLKDIP
jgi:hypothetical protein